MTNHVHGLRRNDKVIFSDESNSFNLFGSNDRRSVHRGLGETSSPKCIKRSVKFSGGSVMVWGMISAKGIWLLVRLHGRVNAAVYKKLAKQHVLSVLRNSANQPAIFKQDNAWIWPVDWPVLIGKAHKANTVMSFFNEETVVVMDMQACSEPRST